MVQLDISCATCDVSHLASLRVETLVLCLYPQQLRLHRSLIGHPFRSVTLPCFGLSVEEDECSMYNISRDVVYLSVSVPVFWREIRSLGNG